MNKMHATVNRSPSSRNSIDATLVLPGSEGVRALSPTESVWDYGAKKPDQICRRKKNFPCAVTLTMFKGPLLHVGLLFL